MSKIIIIDTETVDTVRHKDKNAHPETSLTYDIGWVVADKATGKIFKQRSFVVSEVFYGMTELMKSAYYANKLPKYHEGIRLGLWNVASFKDIYNTFKQDCKDHGIKTVWAYNILFDLKTLNNTIQHFSNGYQRFFFPYKIKLKDIWAYASNITSTKKYVQWVYRHGYLTEHDNPSTSAETVFRYLSNDTDFVEDHTALSDSKIELAILHKAFKRHAKTRHCLGNGWISASNTAKELGFK